MPMTNRSMPLPSRLEAFFSHGASPCALSLVQAGQVRQQQDNGEEEVAQDALLYLQGPCNQHGAMAAGITSLLLQYAFTRAQQEPSRRVVVVLGKDEKPSSFSSSSSSSLQQQQQRGGGDTAATAAVPPRPTIVPVEPCASCGVPCKTGQDNDVWRRIEIKYVARSAAALQRLVCGLHTDTGSGGGGGGRGAGGALPPPPSVLLVDAFERFSAPHEPRSGVFQSLAFLLEARRFMAQATGYGEVVLGAHAACSAAEAMALRRWCRLVTISPRDGAPTRFLLGDHVFEEEEQGDEEDGGRDGAGANSGGDDDADGGVTIEYEYRAPGDGSPQGSFRLCATTPEA